MATASESYFNPVSENLATRQTDFINDGGSDTESEDAVETTTDPFLVHPKNDKKSFKTQRFT